MSMLKLSRTSEFANWLRAYKIFIDGSEVARIRNGKEVTLDVPAGRHSMHLEIDWCSSNAVEFEMGDADLDFECGSNFTGWQLFRGVGKVVTDRGAYLWLRLKQEPA